MGSGVRNGTELKSWRVEKLVPGGAGFARLDDGRVGFAPGAFPGEEIRPLSIEEARDFRRATRFELLTRSPERVEPVCPIVDTCGGCDWMRLELAAQRHHKAGLVVDAFARTGGIELERPPEVFGAGDGLGYRSRVRVHFGRDGSVGFFAKNTQRLVPVARCAVAEPLLNRALDALSSLSRATRAELARFEAAELRAGSGETVELVLFARQGVSGARRAPPSRAAKSEREPAVLVAELAGRGIVAVVPGVRPARGSDSDLRRLELPGGVHAYVPPGAFTQVNPAVNALLVEAVLAGAAARSVRRFLDLFAGVGNFSLPLAASGMAGCAVEHDADAARAAERAAREQGLGELVVRRDDVSRALAVLARRSERFDLIVLDPPRTGAKECLDALLALEPRGIAYVACDPVTLARDAKILLSHGCRLSGLSCFDMFPQTHHVETLCWFDAPHQGAG